MSTNHDENIAQQTSDDHDGYSPFKMGGDVYSPSKMGARTRTMPHHTPQQREPPCSIRSEVGLRALRQQTATSILGYISAAILSDFRRQQQAL